MPKSQVLLIQPAPTSLTGGNGTFQLEVKEDKDVIFFSSSKVIDLLDSFFCK